MSIPTLRLVCAKDIRQPDFSKLPMRRWVNRDSMGNPLNEPSKVRPMSRQQLQLYIAAVKEGSIEAGDKATAEICGVHAFSDYSSGPITLII